MPNKIKYETLKIKMKIKTLFDDERKTSLTIHTHTEPNSFFLWGH